MLKPLHLTVETANTRRPRMEMMSSSPAAHRLDQAGERSGLAAAEHRS